MNELETIKLEALNLDVGETTSVQCVFCHSSEPKLSITRIEEGILYNCYRASCPGSGFIGTLPSVLLEKAESQRKGFVPKPYRVPLQALGSKLCNIMEKSYFVRPQTWAINGIKQANDDTLVMPLYNSQGYVYGHTTKHFSGKLKAIHYLETKTCMLHYALPLRDEMAVLVEDVISAVRIQQDTGWQGIALLGTDLNNAKVKNIREAGYQDILIALDPDATVKAANYRKKYGLFFRTCRNLVLAKDPKNMTPKDLKALIKS